MLEFQTYPVEDHKSIYEEYIQKIEAKIEKTDGKRIDEKCTRKGIRVGKNNHSNYMIELSAYQELIRDSSNVIYKRLI